MQMEAEPTEVRHKIVAFLNSTTHLPNSPEFLSELNGITATVLTYSEDPKLPELLHDFGWNDSTNKFEGTLDTEGLKIALTKRKVRDRGSMRKSNIGNNDTTKSFVPEMLMNMIQCMPPEDVSSSIMTPQSKLFHGICLLVDISGFTRLSGQFCAKGKDGIDELQKATNGYMGQLVEVIYHYDGDVIKFAGDAIICVFSPGTQSKSLSAKEKEKVFSNDPLEVVQQEIFRKAIKCAMELRVIQTETLTVHVALSYGEICFAALGGYDDKWECLISGECLFDLSQCLDDAPSKHVALSKAFLDKLHPETLEDMDGKIMESGNYIVDRFGPEDTKPEDRSSGLPPGSKLAFYNDPSFLSIISKFVPYPVALGLVSGTFEYMAEVREVTTMFMKWDSYDCEAHKDLLSLQNYFHSAQETLSQNGAFMRQFLVDDKGCVLIACWGVPTASYVDNSYRALSAAVVIKDNFNKTGMECSFGITTGNVYCGCIGSKFRREYAAIGDVVNLAARLMCKAKGGVFIDESSYLRLPELCLDKLEKQPPILVKGKSEPMTMYSYTSTDVLQYAGNDNLEVGDLEVRPSTKTILLNHIDAMGVIQEVSPPLKFVLVEGKTGSGKARTVMWFKQEAEKRDLKVVDVSLDAKDAVIEYRAMAKLFRALIGEETFDNPKLQKSVVTHLLKEMYHGDKETSEEVAQPTMKTALGVTCTFNRSKGGGGGENMEARRLPPKVIQDTLQHIFGHLLNMGAAGVVLQNIHFADESSFKTILSLKKLNTRSMVLMTSLDPEDFKDTYGKSETETLSQKLKNSNYGTDSGSSMPSFEWMSSLRKRIVQHEHTTVITLGDFVVEEIDMLLKAKLKGDSRPPPEGLADLVHQLSAGNAYWVREMVDFVHSIGAHEFMKAMSDNTQDTEAGQDNMHLKTPGTRRGSAFTFSDDDGDPSQAGVKPGEGAAGRSSGPDSSTPAPLEREATIRQNNNSNATESTLGKSKLALFIVCRFEKLSADDQRILKNAAVIGFQFSRYVLYGVLPKNLKAKMYDSLRALVKSNWLQVSANEDSEYQFTHPAVFNTLYDVTPSSARDPVHRAIAEYLEDIGDFTGHTCMLLCKHFSYCDKIKAFEYAMKGALSFQKPGELDMEGSLGLLVRAKDFCTCVGDVALVQSIAKRAKLILVPDIPAVPEGMAEMMVEGGGGEGGGGAIRGAENTNEVAVKSVGSGFGCMGLFFVLIMGSKSSFARGKKVGIDPSDEANKSSNSTKQESKEGSHQDEGAAGGNGTVGGAVGAVGSADSDEAATSLSDIAAAQALVLQFTVPARDFLVVEVNRLISDCDKMREELAVAEVLRRTYDWQNDLVQEHGLTVIMRIGSMVESSRSQISRSVRASRSLKSSIQRSLNGSRSPRPPASEQAKASLHSSSHSVHASKKSGHSNSQSKNTSNPRISAHSNSHSHSSSNLVLSLPLSIVTKGATGSASKKSGNISPHSVSILKTKVPFGGPTPPMTVETDI